MNRVKRILVIDNYDSFTYNLVHLLEQLGYPFDVIRNDKFAIRDVESYSHILISPGPGLPQNAGLVMKVLADYKETKSILGVCLGMQALLSNAGADLTNMPTVQHGAEDVISIEAGAKLFSGLRSKIKVGRYHSWAFDEEVIPKSFSVVARSEDGFVMAVEHRSLPLFGVQFHPESIMTEFGLNMIENWISAR